MAFSPKLSSRDLELTPLRMLSFKYSYHSGFRRDSSSCTSSLSKLVPQSTQAISNVRYARIMIAAHSSNAHVSEIHGVLVYFEQPSLKAKLYVVVYTLNISLLNSRHRASLYSPIYILGDDSWLKVSKVLQSSYGEMRFIRLSFLDRRIAYCDSWSAL